MTIQDINPSRFKIDGQGIIPNISQVNTNPLDIRPIFQGQQQFNQNLTTQLQQRKFDIAERQLINSELDSLFGMARKATKRAARQTLTEGVPSADFSTYGLDPTRGAHQEIIGRVQNYFTEAEDAKSQIFDELMSSGQPSQADIRLAGRAIQQIDSELNGALERDVEYTRAVQEHAKFIGFVDRVGKSKTGLNTFAVSKAIKEYNLITGKDGNFATEEQLENIGFRDVAQYNQLLTPIDQTLARTRLDEILAGSLKTTDTRESEVTDDKAKLITQTIRKEVDKVTAIDAYRKSALADPITRAYLESTLMVGYNKASGLTEDQYFTQQLNTLALQEVETGRSLANNQIVGVKVDTLRPASSQGGGRKTSSTSTSRGTQTERNVTELNRQLREAGFSEFDSLNAQNLLGDIKKGVGTFKIDPAGFIVYTAIEEIAPGVKSEVEKKIPLKKRTTTGKSTKKTQPPTKKDRPAAFGGN